MPAYSFFYLSCYCRRSLSWLFLIKRKLKAARTQIKTNLEKTIQYLQEGIGRLVESNIYDKKIFFSQRYGNYQSRLNKNLSELQVSQGITSRLV